jgi:magnesium chelatase family protein
VVLTRARHTIEFPCRFLLVAAANACPCGYGEDHPKCDCPPPSIRRYQAKLSGALADRIDIAMAVHRPTAEEMGAPPGEGSATVRERVSEARERQRRRLGEGRCNAEMSAAEARLHTRLGGDAKVLLASGHEQLGLSGRGYDRVLKLARTMADLEGCDRVGADHVGVALGLRRRSAR